MNCEICGINEIPKSRKVRCYRCATFLRRNGEEWTPRPAVEEWTPRPAVEEVMQCPSCGAQRTGPGQFVKGYCRPCYNNRYIAQYRADGRERPRKHRRTEVRKERAVRCDCGHDAVHRGVMVGGYSYNLCQDCYDLELDGYNAKHQ